MDLRANRARALGRPDRGATTLEDLAYAPFPDISRALPELAAMADAMAITRAMHARLHIPLPKMPVLEPPTGADWEPEPLAMTGTYGQSGREGLRPGSPN